MSGLWTLIGFWSSEVNTPREDIFDKDAERYDSWFDRNPFAYESEIGALRALLPDRGRGLEVGVGTGRFAAELGIDIGLEPSRAMGDLARQRGIDIHVGRAEQMPFADRSFDIVLMVTTICFLGDVPAALREAYRVLCPGGFILIGMLDFSSSIGKSYAKRVADDDFLRNAVPLSVDEVTSHLAQAGFSSFDLRQTIFHEPHAMTEADAARGEYGDGLFVVIRGMKPVQPANGT